MTGDNDGWEVILFKEFDVGPSHRSADFRFCNSIDSWPLGVGAEPFLLGGCSSSLLSVRSLRLYSPAACSKSYARMRPSLSECPRLPTLIREPVLRLACILRRVWILEIISVPVTSVPCPASILVPLGSRRERFNRYTPVKVTRKPHSKERVLTVSVVLKPENRMKEAQRVAVVKVT